MSLELRRLLAHHIHDSARSTETYSRDVLAPAARCLDKILVAIQTGKFRPDASRPQQFKGQKPSEALVKRARELRAAGPLFQCDRVSPFLPNEDVVRV